MIPARLSLFVFFIGLWAVLPLLANDHGIPSRTIEEGWTPYQRVAKILHHFDWDAFVEEKKSIERQLNAGIPFLEDLEGLSRRINQMSDQQEKLLLEMEELRRKTPEVDLEEKYKNITVLIDKIKSRRALILKMQIQVAKATSNLLSSESEKGTQAPSLRKEYSLPFEEEKLKFRPSWTPPVQKYIEPQ